MKLYIPLLLIFVSTTCFAQNSKNPIKDSICTITLTDTMNVSGVVIYSNNKPAVNVSVSTILRFYGVYTQTDSLGRFHLKNVRKIDTLFIESPHFSKKIPNKGSRFLRIVIPSQIESAESRIITTIEGTPQEKKADLNIKLSTECFTYYCSFGPISPEFPGGYNKLGKFLKANLVYPDKALKDNLEGEVVVQFTIGREGTPRDFIISSGLSKECDEAAINALKKMPKWKPGIFYGRPFDHAVSLAVQFVLTR
ncbi:energy transducer TonB [Flavihumibacter sp. R14]|nr:energy transducer TonB [Flavihumibacter soli]